VGEGHGAHAAKFARLQGSFLQQENNQSGEL